MNSNAAAKNSNRHRVMNVIIHFYTHTFSRNDAHVIHSTIHNPLDVEIEMLKSEKKKLSLLIMPNMNDNLSLISAFPANSRTTRTQMRSWFLGSKIFAEAFIRFIATKQPSLLFVHTIFDQFEWASV